MAVDEPACSLTRNALARGGKTQVLMSNQRDRDEFRTHPCLMCFGLIVRSENTRGSSLLLWMTTRLWSSQL